MNLENSIITSSHMPVSANCKASFNESENNPKQCVREYYQNNTNIDHDQKKEPTNTEGHINESTEVFFEGVHDLALYQVIIPPLLTLTRTTKRQREINQGYEEPKGFVSNFSDKAQRLLRERILKNTRRAALKQLTKLCILLHNVRN